MPLRRPSLPLGILAETVFKLVLSEVTVLALLRVLTLDLAPGPVFVFVLEGATEGATVVLLL
jgi:hypothetical protein